MISKSKINFLWFSNVKQCLFAVVNKVQRTIYFWQNIIRHRIFPILCIHSYEDVTSMATLQETSGLLDLALTAALSVCDLEISVAGAKERLNTLYTYVFLSLYNEKRPVMFHNRAFFIWKEVQQNFSSQSFIYCLHRFPITFIFWNSSISFHNSFKRGRKLWIFQWKSYS